MFRPQLVTLLETLIIPDITCASSSNCFNSTGKSRRPVRRHFTAHFDRDNVATRQVSLQNLYSRLVEMAEVNRICMLSGLGPV